MHEPDRGTTAIFTFGVDQTAIFLGSTGEVLLGAWGETGVGEIVVNLESVNADGTGQGLVYRFSIADGGEFIDLGNGARLTRVVPDLADTTPEVGATPTS
jgi:hypothetical protein